MTDYQLYLKALNMMGNAKISDLRDEIGEFLEEPSLEEAVDVLHSFLRVSRAPSLVTFYLANKTAMKHVTRMKAYGCPRSLRNHISNNCNCYKDDNNVSDQ